MPTGTDKFSQQDIGRENICYRTTTIGMTKVTAKTSVYNKARLRIPTASPKDFDV